MGYLVGDGHLEVFVVGCVVDEYLDVPAAAVGEAEHPVFPAVLELYCPC